jgi:hypothetical protein
LREARTWQLPAHGHIEAMLQLFNACPGTSAGSLYASFRGGPIVPLNAGPGGRCAIASRPPSYSAGRVHVFASALR